LERPDKNASAEDVKKVANIHDLRKLWEMVIADAKPKIGSNAWDNYDIPFVEKCIEEFHTYDEKGFAFRYPNQGGEYYRYDFAWFRQAMEHVQQILENITTYLIQAHTQNNEWQAILREEAGF
jgi:hypothetical protein